MSQQKIVTESECHSRKMSYGWSVTVENCHRVGMSQQQIVTWSKHRSRKLSQRRNATVEKCHMVKVLQQKIVTVDKCWVDVQCGSEYHVGRFEGGRNVKAPVFSVTRRDRKNLSLLYIRSKLIKKISQDAHISFMFASRQCPFEIQKEKWLQVKFTTTDRSSLVFIPFETL